MVSDNDMGMTGGSTEEETPVGAEAPEMEQPAVAAPAPKPKSKGGGRRAALRILREDVGTLGKDVASFRKAHDVSTKKLEKQVESLRSEVAALKSHIAKEGAHARTKRELFYRRFLQNSTLQRQRSHPRKRRKNQRERSK